MLIKREDLIARLDKLYQLSAINGLGLEPVMAMIDIKALIFQVPGVEAVPVKHGRWIKGGYACGENEYKCSACGETEWRTGCARMKYCMCCGTKMDLEEQDAFDRCR